MKMQLLTSLIWVLSVGKFATGLTEHLAIKQSSTLPVPGLKSTSGVKLQRPRKPVLCGTTVPGLSKMIRGVDITELELFPISQGKDGFREAIFAYTCEQNKTWTSAVLPNYSFPLPDQIKEIFDRNSDNKVETVNFIHESLRNVKESRNLIRLWKDLGWLGSFSASASYVDAKELMLQQRKTLAEAKVFVHLHQVVHRDGPQMTLNHRFVQELNQLPAKFETKPNAYFAFLDKFGTHYFTEAFFGGAMFLRATISSENFERLELANKTEDDLFGRFNNFVKLDGAPFQWDKQEMSHVLNGTIHYSLQIHGGRTDLANQKQATMQQWINSVPAKPLPIVGSLAQITELIFDKNIRRQMEKAIQIRGLKAYINDFHDVMIKSDFESKLSQQEKKNIDTIRKYVNAPDSVELKQIKKMGKWVDDLFDKFQAVQDIQVIDKCRNRLVDLYNETVKEKIEKISKCPDNPKKKKLKVSIDNLEKWRRDLDTGLAEIKMSYELKKQLPNTFDIRFIRLLTFECEKGIRNITIDC